MNSLEVLERNRGIEIVKVPEVYERRLVRDSTDFYPSV